MGWSSFWPALATIAIACGAQGAELRIAALDTPELRAIQELSGEWEAATGHRLAWTFQDTQAIGERVRQEALVLAAEGAAADRLDIATLDTLQLGVWGEQDWLQPLPAGGSGEAWGAPLATGTALTYYRADLLAARGLVMPEQPGLDDLAKLAAALDAPEAGQAGICLAGVPGPGENLAVIGLFASAIGDAPPTAEALDDPNGSWHAALARYADLLATSGPPDAGALGNADLARRFATGGCAIWVGPSGALASLVQDPGPGPTGWLGVALAPDDPRDGSVGWRRTTSFAVPVEAPHPAEARDFITWATSAAVLEKALPTALPEPFATTLDAALGRAVPAGFDTLHGELARDPLPVVDEIGRVLAAPLAGELTVDAALTVAAGLLDRLVPEWAMANGDGGSGPAREVPSLVRASRLFAGPGQYPPGAFAAYGIVAFPSRATSADLERYQMLCEAYVANLPRTDELGLPVEQQMVTVWPVTEDKIADDLNRAAGGSPCEAAVRNYGLPAALQAIHDVGRARLRPLGRGPLLLAWSPATGKGDPQAIVLIADLSNVTTAEQAATLFALWRQDIEANPELWSRGWNIEALRTGIRLWVDRVGSQIFAVLGA
ncbi:MAG: extracellular solute-binding protein [Geminicoccaceae bacterium]